ncbi:MAG: hypothetical protein LUD69_07720 [Oscillospiraceae bacterium]|nr:hypothetical protein [Oscillospiraceae bacterium]MCD8376817.1 hypothetical protein [Oscillospiraceae bacterium]
MYNRYIPADSAYRPLEPESQGAPPSPGPLEGLVGRLGGLFQGFGKIDSGDILLLLILLLLCADGEDNLDVLIVLGLAVAFGLFHREEDGEN